MKQKLFCILLCILTVLTCAGCGSSGSKPQATIRRYVAAYNHNDKDAMMECYEPAVQELYEKAAQAGKVISAIPGWGALIGTIGSIAQEEAAENRPKLSVKFKGSERVDKETVILTVEYTYTSRKKTGKKVKTEKNTEEQDVKMTQIDGEWYIAAPMDLQKISDSFSQFSDGLSQIGSDLAPLVSGASGLFDGAMSAVGSAFGEYMQGSQQQTTSTAALQQQFSFQAKLPDDQLTHDIFVQLQTGSSNVKLAGNQDFDAIRASVRQILAQYPWLFWAVTGYQMHSDGTWTTIDFAPFQNNSESEIRQQSLELQSTAASILYQLPENLSDYQKALWVHDYLVNNCVYDVKSLNKAETDYCHTAYGCIVQHLAVCEGYAKAYQYLMNALGFECGTVNGVAQNGHAWNYLKIGGMYYWVDVTWDDPVASDGSDSDPGELKHSYFLVDDEHIFRSRTLNADNFFVPQCTSMDMNYYVQNGMYFREYDRGAVLRAISAHYAADSRIEMMFETQEAFARAKQDLVDDNQIRMLPEFETAHYMYSTDEKMYILTFITD